MTLGSDAYIPFRDNVDRAHASGVEYIVEPGGAKRSAEVTDELRDKIHAISPLPPVTIRP